MTSVTFLSLLVEQESIMKIHNISVQPLFSNMQELSTVGLVRCCWCVNSAWLIRNKTDFNYQSLILFCFFYVFPTKLAPLPCNFYTPGWPSHVSFALCLCVLCRHIPITMQCLWDAVHGVNLSSNECMCTVWFLGEDCCGSNSECVNWGRDGGGGGLFVGWLLNVPATG